jgi:YVTN family beta-propeller protein/parallel beta-helix repeat protein
MNTNINEKSNMKNFLTGMNYQNNTILKILAGALIITAVLFAFVKLSSKYPFGKSLTATVYSPSTILATTGANPYRLTIDSAGNIYTANSGANTVSKITPAGVSTIVGTTDANPYDVVVDSAGNIYTANFGSNTVSKITPAGISTILGNTGANPISITVDSAGNVYTANVSSADVTKITPAGSSIISWATTGGSPHDITMDSAGNIYTANEGPGNVSKITPAGVSTILGNTGVNPYDITIDSAGNIYTANLGENTVSKITPAGVSSVFGVTSGSARGIAIDSSGNVYTADTNNNVNKITPAGVSTIIGTTDVGPNDLTIDSAGNVYTANYNASNVTKIAVSIPPPPLPPHCTIAPDNALYTVCTYLSDDTFTAPTGINSVDVLVIAGGGAGGWAGGGGGGAGGLLYGTYSVTPGVPVAVTIGNGGLGAKPQSINGTNSFFGIAKAIGGAAGSTKTGFSGGNGGGAGANGGNFIGGVATQRSSGGLTGFGFSGGSAINVGPYPAGGGGGAGGAGVNGLGSIAGNGGAGASYSISGSSVCYAGGGGGATAVSGGIAGTATCGGGAGTNSAGSATPGTANTGGGGGGTLDGTLGANGGSGIVIVRYLTSGTPLVSLPPVSLATDNYLWIANSASNSLSKIDKSTNSIITTIPDVIGPFGISVDTDSVWVTNYNPNYVSRINKATGLVVTTIPVSAQPYGIASDPDFVWVSQSAGSAVVKIDKLTNTINTTIPVGTQPQAFAIDYNFVWVSNSGNGTVSKINKDTNSVVDTIATGQYPFGIVVDSNFVWVANSNSNTVSKIDKNTDLIVATISVSNPNWLTSDFDSIWVTGADKVTRISKVTNAILGTVSVPSAYGISADQNYLWVSSYTPSGPVTKISKASISVLATISTGSYPANTGDSTGLAYDLAFSNLVPPPPPPALACGDTITSNATLSADMNCSGTGLTIGADNITLDCAGHSIFNSLTTNGDGAGTGISLANRTGVTVKNCTLSGFNNGISLTSSSNNNVNNNTISYPDSPVDTSGGFSGGGQPSGGLDDYQYGIYISSSTGNNIANNNITNNIVYGGRRSLGGNFNYNVNSQYGIYLSSSSGNTVTNNSFTHNKAVGARVGYGTTNVQYGIYLDNSSGNTISGSIVSDNTVIDGIIGLALAFINDDQYGVYLTSSSNNNILNNLLSSSKTYDLFIDDANVSSNNTLTNNTGTSNLVSNPDLDSDGIPNAIDRNSSGTDEKNTPSNNFNDSGVSGTTFGTITAKSGWTLTVEDLPAPLGVRVSISGSGSGMAKIVSCSNNVESQLDVLTETTDITCGATSGTLVKATQANTIVNVREPDSSVTTGTIIRVRLTTGQSVNMGSYIIPGADNTESIVAEVIDQNSVVLGSVILSPAQSIDITPTANATEAIVKNIGTTPVTYTILDSTSATIGTVTLTPTQSVDIISGGTAGAPVTVSNTGTTPVAVVIDGTSISIPAGQTSTDQCPGVAGNVGGTGCPFAVKTVVDMQTVDQQKSGICGYDKKGKPLSDCKKLLEGSEVRVFNRENPDFMSLYKSKRPEKTKLDLIFEGGIGQVGTCTTDASGVCTVGTNTSGKYLMIAKYVDGVNTVYTGKYQNFKRATDKSEEEDDEDNDARTVKNTLLTKKLHFIKTISKSGTVKYTAGTVSVFTGSELTVLYPESPVWEGTTELYPFIMTSDSDWTVDVCLQVPAGYSLKGVQDVNGVTVSTSNCSQSLVTGTPVVVLFSLADIGSPEPTLGLSLTTTHKGKKTKTDVKMDGVRRKTKNTQEKDLKVQIKQTREKIKKDKAKEMSLRKAELDKALALKDRTATAPRLAVKPALPRPVAPAPLPSKSVWSIFTSVIGNMATAFLSFLTR